MASRSEQIPYEDFFLSNGLNNHKNYLSSDEKAAWSPSWLASSGSKPSQQEYVFRDTERNERRALHMELPNNTGGNKSISNALRASFGAAPDRSQSPQDDYPFFFSDPVEGGSVQTGMSQQELLRKKVRESKKQTRYGKSNKTKRKNPVVQITGFLSSRGSSSRNAYPTSPHLPSSIPSKLTGGDDGLVTDTVAARWPRGKQDSARSDDIELSTAETTLTDSSSRHRSKNPPSPLRVVLNGGDLVLTARQNRYHPEFSKLDGGDEDFPLLSCSASDSFQMDIPFNQSEKGSFSGRAYLLHNPPSIAREHHEARSSNDFLLGEPRVSTRSDVLLSDRSINYSASSEWLLHSQERGESVEEKDQSRSVRFRDNIIRPASFGSHNGYQEKQNGDRKPKSILRESRYRTKPRGVLPSSSPSRNFIRKPATPERNDHLFAKSPQSVHSPSGVLDETRRIFSPTFNETRTGSDERYPDPPLDSVNIDDDDTTYASRNDAFLETIAAIVIQAAIRRFLAMRYVDMLTEHIANEMHAKYVQLYKNENKMLLSAPLPESLTHGIPAERPRPQTSPNRPSAPSHPTDRDQHQMHSSTHTAVTPLPETLTNRVPAERPKPQTSPNRPSASSRRTDRDRELEENLQQRMVYDMYNHAAIRIQAAFRGFWARDSLDVDHFCASLIQRCVRRFLHVKKYSRGHYHVFPYAVRIQSMWRGVLARQNLHRSIGAAILIQAYTRGFIGRLLSREKKINTQRRIESVKSEKPAIPKGTGDSSWQKGLANGLWQARIIRMSDNEERLPSALNSRPHTADFSKSFSEEQSRSLSFAHLKDQQTSSSATQEQFPSFHRPEAKKLSARYHPPDTFTPVTLSRVATIKVSAAIKIQTRYRTYACERKLIRSLVDILIAQTVIRRWLARRRAARLRTLRDRCRIILENGDSKLSDCQSTTAPRLVSRSEFFQNRILQPRGHVSHPHFNSTSDSGPSFGEDEFRQPGKDRRATNNKTTKYLGKSSSDEDEQNQTYGYHNVVNGSTSSSFRRTKSPGGGMSDSQVPTQLPQWANMTLRSTKSKATLHETSTDRLENRTPPQLTGSSESESRVYSIPSYDSETRSTTSATHPAANLGRRQVVVTPPVLLKKNTDRKVSQR